VGLQLSALRISNVTPARFGFTDVTLARTEVLRSW
jgi:hypothetical protein